MHYLGAIVNWFFVFHNEFCLMQTEREPKGRRLFLAGTGGSQIACVALYLNRRLLYYFSWAKLSFYFVAFNSQWQSASEEDWALALAREAVLR